MPLAPEQLFSVDSLLATAEPPVQPQTQVTLCLRAIDRASSFQVVTLIAGREFIFGTYTTFSEAQRIRRSFYAEDSTSIAFIRAKE